ncbi:MAG: hypothetical protein WBD26_03835, partial [Candidatus Acidiferrales bacterium]
VSGNDKRSRGIVPAGDIGYFEFGADGKPGGDLAGDVFLATSLVCGALIVADGASASADEMDLKGTGERAVFAEL